jgi:hypothetical protein
VCCVFGFGFVFGVVGCGWVLGVFFGGGGGGRVCVCGSVGGVGPLSYLGWWLCV